MTAGERREATEELIENGHWMGVLMAWTTAVLVLGTLLGGLFMVKHTGATRGELELLLGPHLLTGAYVGVFWALVGACWYLFASAREAGDPQGGEHA